MLVSLGMDATAAVNINSLATSSSLASKYLRQVRRSISAVQCVFCRIDVLPRHMNRHMTDTHNEITHFKCVWCMQYTWCGRVSKEVNKHRYMCLLQHSSGGAQQLNPHPSHFPLPESGVTNLFCNNMEIDIWYERYGSSSSVLVPPPTVSASIFHFVNHPEKFPEWLLTLDGVDDVCSFRNECPMDSAVGIDPIWQKLFSFKRNLAWVHVAIRFSTWQSFCDFLAANKTRIYFLPYSCLCNGGQEQHRHLIGVLQTKDMNAMFGGALWHSISAGLISLDVVKNPLQLVTTICALSSIDTVACSFHKRNDSLPCQFFIFRPVIPLAAFFVMLYIPGGIDLYLRHFYSESVDYVQCRSLRCDDSTAGCSVEYRDLIKDVATIFPLPRHLQFTVYSGGESSFLYVGDCRYSMQRNDNLLTMTRLQWNVHQVRTGNCFAMNLGSRRFQICRRLHRTIRALAEIIRKKDSQIAELERRSSSSSKKIGNVHRNSV